MITEQDIDRLWTSARLGVEHPLEVARALATLARELLARAKKAEAEMERLRGALEAIVNTPHPTCQRIGWKDIARAALSHPTEGYHEQPSAISGQSYE